MQTSIHTQCVHAGSIDDPQGGVNSPVSMSTAYSYLGEQGVLYPRYYNTPNQQAVAAKIATLEQAEQALLFASGMGAISTVILSQLRAGDHIVVTQGGYGGTEDFMQNELPRLGINVSFCGQGVDDIESAITPKTRMIYVETPSNPLLSVINLSEVAELAKQHNCLSAVDNTFATPIGQQPIKLGIDISIHSATKYLGGHSDISAGAVASSAHLIQSMHNTAVRYGACLNAMDTWLLERSLKTLALRIDRQSSVALELAEALQQQDSIEATIYPGLSSHPHHNLAKSQMHNFGSMLAFRLAPNINPNRFEANLSLIRSAVSLGGVESTVCRPCLTSHAKLPNKQREALGITSHLLRMSVGIESAQDLLEDIQQAIIKG